MKQSNGNGSGKFEIDQVDMGGWVRIHVSGGNAPDDLPIYLSQALSDWFRQRPQFRMRCVVPIYRDGDTVEFHAWYDAHVFPSLEGPQPTVQKQG